MHQFGEVFAAPVGATLDRADSYATHIRSLFIRKSRGADQDQRFALFIGQLFKRPAEIAHLKVPVMGRLFRHAFGERAIYIRDLAFDLATTGVVGVAQDCEQPGTHVGANLKFLDIGPGLDHRVLNHVIRRGAIARQA